MGSIPIASTGSDQHFHGQTGISWEGALEQPLEQPTTWRVSRVVASALLILLAGIVAGLTYVAIANAKDEVDWIAVGVYVSGAVGLATAVAAAFTAWMAAKTRSLASATTAMAVATQKDADASANMVSESQRDREMAYRPVLTLATADVTDGGTVMVRNIGVGPALGCLAVFRPPAGSASPAWLVTVGRRDIYMGETGGHMGLRAATVDPATIRRGLRRHIGSDLLSGRPRSSTLLPSAIDPRRASGVRFQAKLETVGQGRPALGARTVSLGHGTLSRRFWQSGRPH